MFEWVDLDVLKPCHTGGLTSNFAPGVGKLTVFNTWLVLSSPLCPGGEGAVVTNRGGSRQISDRCINRKFN